MRIRSFYPIFCDLLFQQRAGKSNIAIFISCCAVLLTLTAPGHASAPRQNLKQLETEVAAFLNKTYADADVSRVEVTVGNLDPRLALPACENLSMSLNDSSRSGGNITVQTQCEDKGWSLYVPAQVSLFRPLAVASRNLGRGEVIKASDISIEIIDISQLRQGYLAAKEAIIGQELSRPISKGESFRSSILDAPMVISRGDEVSIEIQAGTIAVTSTGTAMSNGRIGERIRVRNNQSERVVSAEVVSAGKVKTAL